jgi:hypothetical protein
LNHFGDLWEMYQTIMPVTRSTTRALLKDEADKAEFLHKVNDEISRITRPEQLLIRVRSIRPSGQVGACKLIMILNAVIERFMTKSLTVVFPKGEISFVAILGTIRAYCQTFMNRQVETNPWIGGLLRKACLEYMTLYDYLFSRSTSTCPTVIEEQARIMRERTEAFVKSPYFLELGARLHDPVKFNGWFEDHGMCDEDGFLE